MPSDNKENGAVIPEKGKKNGKDRKHGKSIGWIIGVVVLILISVTFILPTTVFSTSNSPKITFGRYNGKDINLEFTYDNYFYNQLYSLAQTYSMNAQNMMQIYAQAFYQTVYQTALSEMADDASIFVSDRMLSNAIFTSGLFRDEEGKFDMEAYNAASKMEKDSIKEQIIASLPAQMVAEDIASVKTSDAETDFVASLNDSPRAFQYITVDYSSYPDADAASYASADPAPFMTMELSSITAATETAASDIIAAIESGEKTFEEAAAENASSAFGEDENGYMGAMMFMAVEDLLTDPSAAETIFQTETGSMTAPIETYAGWTVFRADSAAAEADLSDADVLDSVKRYILLNEPETIESFLSVQSEAVYAAAVEDFDAAASEYGLTITEVSDSSYNPGLSSFIIDFAGNDPEGLLYNAAMSDETFYRSLYTAEDNTVLPPAMTGSSYVIARPIPTDGTANASLISYVNLMYAMNSAMMADQDLQSSILSSGSFEDNFISTYLTEVLSTSVQ